MLHCCWLIDPWKSSRERYLESWADLGQPVVLWHAGQISSSPHPKVVLRDARELFREGLLKKAWDYELYHRNHAACADLLRYEALFQLGGGYFDLDVLPHSDRMSAEALELIASWKDLTFGSLSAVRHLHGDVEIRFIYAGIKEHPLLLEIRERCAQRTQSYIDKGGHSIGVTASGIMSRTGPILVTQVLQERLQALPEDAREAQLQRWLYPFATKDDTIDNMREHLDKRFDEIDAIAGFQSDVSKRSRCARPEIPGGKKLNVRYKHPFLGSKK